MIKTQRQREILRLLEKKDTFLISDLAKLLNCSMMTIRRDVDEMESESIVNKVHGGVELTSNQYVEPNFKKRIMEHIEEKQRIAAEAVKYVTKGCVVFIDAGTTPLHVVKLLPVGLEFTAITNCIMTAAELCTKPNATVIMLGGEVNHDAYATVNDIAINTAKNFKTDLAIISTYSILLPEGLYENTLSLIEIKKTLVDNAKEVILLSDHSKFSETAMCASIPLTKIDHVITDNETSDDKVEELVNLGLKVTQV